MVRNKKGKSVMKVSTRHIVLTASMALVTGLTIGAATAARASDADRADQASVAFVQTNLDSNIAGRAKVPDPNLQNGWGIAFAPGGPFWVNDNHAGISTLYAGDGSIVPLVVTIPPPMGSQSGFVSSPTGMIWNATSGFLVPGSKIPAAFIFDTEDGTISAWNFNVDPANAVLAVDNSPSGAVYKGLAFGTNVNGNNLYATNFHAGTIEVFDKNFAAATTDGKFVDRHVPSGFAPFGIQNIDGDLWVTYAKQDADKHDDVGGPGAGFVDVFDTDGHLLRRFAEHGALNSPWGLARAPYSFGQFSGDILVGNFKDGRINAFDSRGNFHGALRRPDGHPVSIDGLWALAFGGGAKSSPESLYFTAGPDDETNGVFGVINADPQADGHD
jgi:uncharacterized protein (TIGR03118 family)